MTRSQIIIAILLALALALLLGPPVNPTGGPSLFPTALSTANAAPDGPEVNLDLIGANEVTFRYKLPTVGTKVSWVTTQYMNLDISMKVNGQALNKQSQKSETVKNASMTVLEMADRKVVRAKLVYQDVTENRTVAAGRETKKPTSSYCPFRIPLWPRVARYTGPLKNPEPRSPFPVPLPPPRLQLLPGPR